MTEKQELVWGPFRDGQGMEFSVKLHYRGRWHPLSWQNEKKKTFGKATMVIQIRNPDTNQIVDYSPTHDDLCKVILGAILQAELDNDMFIFTDGAYGTNSTRPTQIFKKITQVKQVLQQWEEKATAFGLVGSNLSQPNPNLAQPLRKLTVGDFY